jgi:hypothetical protein
MEEKSPAGLDCRVQQAKKNVYPCALERVERHQIVEDSIDGWA